MILFIVVILPESGHRILSQVFGSLLFSLHDEGVADQLVAAATEHFGPPDVLQLETIPAPQPVADQVLVRLRAIGVNPVDTYIRSGAYAALPPLPYTPGTDAAGVIAEDYKLKRWWD